MFEPGESLIAGLKARYGEPQRHYHTWSHIEALRTHYDHIQDQLNDPISVLWALYWHDAIYDPQANDNEDKSADLLRKEAPPDLGQESLERADRIIRATKSHQIPSGLTAEDSADLALFLDIDLSILGTPQPVFDRYEAQIREEYAFVPADIYRQARSQILRGFLTRERLYFSEHYYAIWETAARENLQRSIDQLERKGDTHV